MTPQRNNLVLGTVQFGMKYGLHNTHGQPTHEESFAILDAALAAGIDTFDTAWAYGTAEDVLGAWLSARDLAGKVKIISKMRPHAVNDYPDGTVAGEIVQQEIEKSLTRLGVTTLDGYLFHSPHYIYMSHLIEGLRKAQREGKIGHIGVSIYNEGEALQAAELSVDYVQVPYNAFDQRLDATDFFAIAKKNGVAVFTRSPFLQGLLLMQPHELPLHLGYLRPHLERFVTIAEKHGFSQAEAALRFSSATRPEGRVVFGVEELSQLNEDISIMDTTSAATDGLVADIREAFKDLNHGAINPSLWSRIK